MAFTEFYCDASTGNNLNAGSDTNGTATYTSTNGNWNGSTSFTPTDGTNPVSAGVTVGQFASVYLDAASAPTAFIARITAVTNANNGAITVSATAQAGTRPSSSATGRTIKVGGVWKGPTGTSGFPFVLTTGIGSLGAATNSSNDTVRVNFKNNATYSITSAVSGTAQGAVSAVFQGYSTNPGDGGRATLDGGGNNIQILATGQGQQLVDFVISNVGVTTGTSTGLTLGAFNTAFRVIVHDVRGTGITAGQGSVVIECEVYAFNKSNTAGLQGINLSSIGAAIRNYIHHGTGSNCEGLTTASGTTSSVIKDNVFDTLGGNGVVINSSASSSFVYTLIANNDFYNNTGSGIKVAATAGQYFIHVENNNFIKNGAYAINGGATFTRLLGYMFNNGYGSGTQANSSGNYHTTGSLVLDDATGTNTAVTYAANQTPYNAPTTGDFKLIDASAISAGRGAFTQTDGTNTGSIGYPDIGAVQALVTAGGGGKSSHVFCG